VRLLAPVVNILHPHPRPFRLAAYERPRQAKRRGPVGKGEGSRRRSLIPEQKIPKGGPSIFHLYIDLFFYMLFISFFALTLGVKIF
jgi:hypothetical protein